jgi:hypothetical protein
MMKFLYLVIALIIGLAGQATAQDCFGDCKAVNKDKAMSTARLAEAVKAINQQPTTTELNDVTLTGSIVSVCQAKGCWATMQLPNGEMMTIKFKDYAFFLPKDCATRSITIHGKMFGKTTSVAELKHLAEDAGKKKKEIKKIKEPKQEVRFEADGVLLS